MVDPSLDYERVLHVSDPAFTASLLCTAARETGRNWSVLPVEGPSKRNSALAASADRAARGVRWELRYAFGRLRHRRVHLHSALALPHVSWALGDYALHLHGTDIRTRQYEPEHEHTIRKAVTEARAVFYSTPDLREHVSHLRADARLVPVPVAPYVSSPVPSRLGLTSPYVFFPSRWEEVKGGQRQIQVASLLRNALPSSIQLVGLAWGPLQDDARRAGVHLIPTLPHIEYRAVIGNARLAIGQLSGVMGASELDSLAAGVPTVVPLNPEWYDASDDSLINVPVLGGIDLDVERNPSQIVDLAIDALDRGAAAASLSAAWVERFHSPHAALDRVLAGYRRSGW